MPYRSETIHQVGQSTITVKEVSGFPEFHVIVDNDRYEVFLGNADDPGTDPGYWYTEVGGTLDGPYPTAEALISDLFLNEGEGHGGGS